MIVRVQFTAQLRTALGRAEKPIELPEGSTLATLLSTLASGSAAAVPHLLAGDGEPRPSLLVVINGTAFPAREAAVKILNTNDEIVLLPPIAGG